MLTFTTTFQPENDFFTADTDYKKEEVLFFDIETTGLSADTSSLYLIGCLYWQGESWQSIQWFADDYVSEKDLLTSFFTFLEDFSILIHYNGSGFDIPYLLKKCRQHKLPFTFDNIQSLDIYKELTPYKKLLPLPNLKQKTIERSLSLCREDKYDGGELIKVYVTYIHQKLKRQAGCEECLSLLLLHNREDLQGLFTISVLLQQPRLSYTGGSESSPSFSYTLSLPYALSYSFTLEKGAVRLIFNKEQAQLTLTPFTGVLKYFYPNYKDYYYLPYEDTAIHKSVAEYVDKAYREKAKAATCYTKKNGSFLPLPSGYSLSEHTPVFYKEYKDKTGFFELNEEFLSSETAVLEYIKASLLSNSR